MRKKVKKSLTILTALALLVSMFCDSGLFVNAEEPAVEAEVMNDGGEETAVIVEYVPVEQPEGISVKAYAEQGVLPEGTTMSVTALDENGDSAPAYQEAVQALEDNGVEYDGMLAYDISFYDASGNEIEPEDGKVQVKMELNSDLLPEEADAQSIEVQHHVETADGIQVESVADAADVTEGTVAADENTVTAEFAVDSFSSFTITWTGKYTSSEVTIKYVDQDGQEIEGSQKNNITLTNGSTVTLSSYAKTINDYTYLGARIGDVNGKSVIQLLGRYGFCYYKASENDDWKALEETVVVLVYQKNAEVAPPKEVEEKKLAHEKTVTENQDGTYDLRLTVSGAVGSITEPAKLDVIFVLDVSTSMRRDLDNNDGNLLFGYSNERITKASDAIKTMTDSLSANQKIDSRYALVTFGTTASTDYLWYSDKTQFNSKVPTEVEYNNGTNYQDGLIKTKELLGNVRTDASVAVVFVSDGDPSKYNTDNGTAGIGSGYDATAMLKAQQEMTTLSADYFFTVGVGMASNYSKLEYLTNPQMEGSPAKGKDVYLVQGMETKNYAGTDTVELKKAFDDIEAKITNILCDNVAITDDLSENVQLVMSDDKPAKLVVSVEDENGGVKYGPNEKLTIPATEKNATVELIAEYVDGNIQLVFPETYQLEIGWTYVVTAQIDATEQAYENYRSYGNNYPDIGDDATGTYAGQSGLYSNDKAEVSYHYNDQNYTEEYSMPVIRLHPGTLVVQKTISGLDDDEEALASLESKLSFDIEMNGEVTNHKLEDFKYDIGTKTYSYSISGLSPNTQYKITEKDEAVEGYDINTTVKNDQGTIVEDGNAIAEFTNAYTPSDRTLTITKNVSGNMGDTNKVFDFALTLTKNGNIVSKDLTYTKDGDTYTLQADSGKYIFTLKHNETIVLTIPYGCEYTISETGLEAGYKVKINGTDDADASITGTLTADTTVEFTNTKNITTPTGLVRTIAPFAIMLVAGVAIVVGLFFGNRRRSRR